MGRRRRSRRFRRIGLIAVCAVGIVAAGATAFAVRQHRLDADSRDGRERGRAALAAGDFPAAIEGLGRYLQRHVDKDATAEDYVLYARARRGIPLPNDVHLKDAIASLRKALQLDPSNEETKDALLGLYLETGYTTEALELIDKMLVSRPGDLSLLRTRRDVLEALHRHSAALEAAKRVDEAAPDDLSDRLRTLRLLAATGASEADIDAWAAAQAVSHAGNAQFELLSAAAYIARHDQARADAALDHIVQATAETADSQFRLLLVGQLDASGRFGDSLAVLRGTRAVDGPEIGRELARRLWYAGRLEELATRPDLHGAEAVSADPEVVSLRAMALQALGRGEEAAPLRQQVAALSDRTGNAWATLLESQGEGAAEGSERASALAQAVRDVPLSACLHKALGDAYASLGETDLALEYWTAAAKRGPGWALPLRQIAETLLATGREHLAPAMAQAAMTVAPNDVANISTYLRAMAAASGNADSGHVDKLLSAVTKLRAAAPGGDDETLPLYVGLLARVDKATAERRMEEALQSATPPNEATLLRLARVAHEAGIPFETKFLDLSETIHGVSPRLALARAVARARVAGPDEGLRALDAACARAAAATRPAGSPEGGGGGASRRDADDLEWALVRAGYLESARMPEAGPAWIALAESHPAALPAQLGAVASMSAWQDREAVARVIDRIRQLTGEQAVTWRTARARWLMSDPAATEGQITEAAVMLGAVVRTAPRNASTRLLLAEALEKLRNPSGAEEQLRIASEIAPDDMWIALEVARLAQQQGRREAAARQLDRVLTSKDLVPDQAERAAYLLALSGDRGRSIELLEPLASRASAGRRALLLLARLNADLGRFERATELCDRLLADPDAAVVEFAAGVHAKAGRSADADSTLSRLDSMKLPAGDRELARARHAAVWGTAESARDWYRRAVAAAPQRADAWNAFLSHAIAGGDAATVASVLDDRRAAVAEAVRFLAGRRDLCAAAVGDGRLRALLLAATTDVADRDVLADAILKAAQVGGAQGDRTAKIRVVQELADSNARVLPLQLLAADLSAEAGEIKRGCEIARRAMDEHPNSIAAARQAAGLYARAGRWDDAVSAGTAWRDRGGRRDPRSEVFVAEVLSRAGRAADGAAALDPLVPNALAHPDENAEMLMTYAVALVRGGRAEEATQLFAELAERSVLWRTLPLRIEWTRFGEAAEASAWMKACSSHVPSDAASQVQLARAWGGAWETFRTPEMLAKAEQILASVAAGPDPPAEADSVAGTLAQEAGDGEAARARFESALRRDPNLVSARNNLAMIHAGAGRWKEAATEAAAALRVAPGCAAVYDTLAHALRGGKHSADAVPYIRKAVALEPANPAWHVGLAETLSETGEFEEITRVIARVDELVSQGVSLTPAVRERLERLRSKPR